MSEKNNKYYAGIGPVPKGKVRAPPEYCLQNNLVRYYGLVAIDKELLEKFRKNKESNLQKEQLRLRRLQDEAKIIIKEYRNLKLALKHEEKPSSIKRIQTKLDSLVVKKDKLVKNLKRQQQIVDNLMQDDEDTQGSSDSVEE